MNITNISINNFQDFLTVVNQEVGGSFGLGITIIFCIVGFIYLNKRYNSPVSLFLSLTLCLPLVSILTMLNLFEQSAFFVYILLLGILGVYIYIKRGKE